MAKLAEKKAKYPGQQHVLPPKQRTVHAQVQDDDETAGNAIPRELIYAGLICLGILVIYVITRDKTASPDVSDKTNEAAKALALVNKTKKEAAKLLAEEAAQKAAAATSKGLEDTVAAAVNKAVAETSKAINDALKKAA